MGSSIDLATNFTLLKGEDAEFQRKEVAALLGLDERRPRFPGAQPISFARRHLEELQHVDYFMCEKTDGVRCLLFLTQISIEGQPAEAQFLIDRKNDYYYVREDMHLPRPDHLTQFHRGTLLDGELVRQKKGGRAQLAYLIFDCLAMDGENVTSKPFDKRLARIESNISAPLKKFTKDWPADVADHPFQVEMKAMQFPYTADRMFDEIIPTLPHGNDGLIFTCRSTPYKTGTDDHILKWKPPHENTIDFRLILGPFPVLEDEDGDYEDWDAKPEMELHINHGDSKGYERYANLSVSDTEWNAMKGMDQRLDGRIIECYKHHGRWRPKLEPAGYPRFRDDKTDANHVTVAASVQESIDDAVTQQDLVAAKDDIRNPFKARQKAREDQERRRLAEEEQRRRGQERPVQQQPDDGPKYED